MRVRRRIECLSSLEHPIEPRTDGAHKCIHIDPGVPCAVLAESAETQSKKQAIYRADPDEVALMVVAVLEREKMKPLCVQGVDSHLRY